MLKSMTAYGRASSESALGRFVVEIQSVNRKFLEINTVLPRELLCFDGDIKKCVGAKVGRGQVNVRVSLSYSGEIPVVVSPNASLAKEIMKAAQEIAKTAGGKGEVSLDFLLNVPGVLQFQEELKNEKACREALQKGVEAALGPFLEMKELEGKVLQEDISGRIRVIEKCVSEIASRAPNATQKYRQKLVARLEEVLPGCVENEEKILREVSVYAERIDIEEEITRLRSHLEQLVGVLVEPSSVGKKIEYLLQEMNREVNTIASKSSDLEVSRYAIEIKSELERVREQVQNIE